jgi:hypothetical protein
MASKLAVYRFFRPSAELISLLESRLFSEQWLASPPLPKKLGRFGTLHYLLFCFTLKLTGDWTLEHQPQERANVQLALYATHLATGSTLHYRSIKAATINSYLTLQSSLVGFGKLTHGLYHRPTQN